MSGSERVRSASLMSLVSGGGGSRYSAGRSRTTTSGEGSLNPPSSDTLDARDPLRRGGVSSADEDLRPPPTVSHRCYKTTSGVQKTKKLMSDQKILLMKMYLHFLKIDAVVLNREGRQTDKGHFRLFNIAKDMIFSSLESILIEPFSSYRH